MVWRLETHSVTRDADRGLRYVAVAPVSTENDEGHADLCYNFLKERMDRLEWQGDSSP